MIGLLFQDTVYFRPNQMIAQCQCAVAKLLSDYHLLRYVERASRIQIIRIQFRFPLHFPNDGHPPHWLLFRHLQFWIIFRWQSQNMHQHMRYG